MSTTMKYFNSNETLEMCDVRISENGTIEVATKSYHSEGSSMLSPHLSEPTIHGNNNVAMHAIPLNLLLLTFIMPCKFMDFISN